MVMDPLEVDAAMIVVATEITTMNIIRMKVGSLKSIIDVILNQLFNHYDINLFYNLSLIHI